jgi:hypothetical protein
MPNHRFLVIAWPEDHEEELSDYARDIQSMLDLAQVGGACVYMMLTETLSREIKQAIKDDDLLPV